VGVFATRPAATAGESARKSKPAAAVTQDSDSAASNDDAAVSNDLPAAAEPRKPARKPSAKANAANRHAKQPAPAKSQKTTKNRRAPRNDADNQDGDDALSNSPPNGYPPSGTGSNAGGYSSGTTSGSASGSGVSSISSNAGGSGMSASSSTVNGKFTGKITINGVAKSYHDPAEYQKALTAAQQQAGANPIRGMSGARGFPQGFTGIPGGTGANAVANGNATASGSGGGRSVSTSSTNVNGKFKGRITVDGEDEVYDTEADYQERLDELREDGLLPR
jgi:hypothetical protein